MSPTRPMVVLASCEAAGGTIEQGLPAACAIEVVHAYSLVHDDLPAMDDDAERRGQPTVHVKFGEDKAILTGDALLTIAFELLAGASHGRVAQAVVKLARHAGIEGMVGGQAMDLEAGQDIRDLELLEAVHAKKTGGFVRGQWRDGSLARWRRRRRRRPTRALGHAVWHRVPACRRRARRRPAGASSAGIGPVETLVAQCNDLVAPLGEQAQPLRAIAAWVAERAVAAARGEERD